MSVVNLAGKYLCSMHPWRWLARRPALVDLEAGLNYVRLPKDLLALIAVRGATSAANDLWLSSMDAVHSLRLYNGQTYPWAGAVARRVMPARNLLRYSDAPGQSAAWGYTNGTGAITANAFIDPHTGLTTASTVSDSDVTAVSALAQTIPAHLLKDATKYTISVELAPSPIVTTTPPKSGLLISTPSPSSNGLQTLVEIQWGTTPWQDAPTATVIGTNSGLGAALTPVPVGQGVWRFSVAGYTHELNKNYGTMLVSVQPSRAAWADASGTEDVTQTGTVAFVRAWANEGVLPFEYESTASVVATQRMAEPVLEVVPVPTESSAGALSILYRAGWAEAEDDGDILSLPSEGWLDSLYIELVRAYARGWEEQGSGSLSARIKEIKDGPLFSDAKAQDGEIQAQRGPVHFTAWDMAQPSRWGGSLYSTSFDNASPA